MKKDKLMFDYFEESMQRLVKAEQSLPPIGPFLLNRSQLTPADRDRVVEQVISLAEEWGASIETLQLSIALLDRFSALQHIPPSVFKLVAIICLTIALKYHDPIYVSIQEIIHLTRNAFPIESIINTEFFIYQTVEPFLKTPSAAEFVRHLIYATGVNYDFSKVIERADGFCLIFYGDYSLSMFSPLAIAIVGTVCSLEQYRQQSFRNQWLRFLNKKIVLDIDVLDDCKRNLLRKLKRMTVIQDRSMLECLEKESIQSIMSEFLA